jgi:uncharacterized protein
LRRWLVDTGPFVAYLDRTEPRHQEVAVCLDEFAGQLITTSAVVTEVMYFMADGQDGPESFAELLVAGRVEIIECGPPSRVLSAAHLMKKYADTPMDFADATLVSAADRLGVLEILTLDRRGFSTFRTPSGKRFRLVLER